MAIIREHGVNLAVELAAELTDLEFEMLIRERIKRVFNLAHERNPNLSESHNYCTFTMSWGDEAKWNIALGQTYTKKADVYGQVLAATIEDAEAIMDRQSRNKLSLLLTGPELEAAD
jgi:hypothetical protein